MKRLRIDAQVERDRVGDAPSMENLAQMLGGNQRRDELAVELDDVVLGVVEDNVAEPGAAVF